MTQCVTRNKGLIDCVYAHYPDMPDFFNKQIMQRQSMTVHDKEKNNDSFVFDSLMDFSSFDR